MKMNELLNKTGFCLKKHSPEILLVAGVVGTVVSTVMACRATTKLSGILNETKEDLDKIHKYADNSDNAEKYSAEDAKKDTAIVYKDAGLKLIKLYGPAVLVSAMSISSILAAHGVLRKRNAGLSAALSATAASFKEYRSRVVERFGKEADYQLRHNIRSEKTEDTVTDENGKEKKVKKTVEVADPGASDFVKYFTRSNPYWENTPEYIDMFLRSQQNYANDRLRVMGHLTLNEVYDMLGFKPTKAGMVVGWIYNPVNPHGDNFVEFDVKKVHLPDEKGGYDEAYAIDFNVDGDIYNEMV